MDPRDMFAKAVEETGGCVTHVTADKLSNPTPCRDWDLRALLNHVVYELRWMPDLLMGKTITEVGNRHEGDVLGHDPSGAWQHAADAALVAVKRADLDRTVHLSYGDVPASHYIKEMANDVLIHGWDVAQSMNSSLIFEPTLAQNLYDFMEPRKDELVSDGTFAAALEVGDNDDIQTKLLALLGRKAKAL